MIIKFLGILDIICSVIILLSLFLPQGIIRICGIYLVVKGIVFGLLGIGHGGLEFVSIIDAFIGIYLLTGISIGFFRIVFFIFLLQKGLFSLF